MSVQSFGIPVQTCMTDKSFKGTVSQLYTVRVELVPVIYYYTIERAEVKSIVRGHMLSYDYHRLTELVSLLFALNFSSHY